MKLTTVLSIGRRSDNIGSPQNTEDDPDLQDNSLLNSYLDHKEGCCAFLLYSLSKHGLSKDFA